MLAVEVEEVAGRLAGAGPRWSCKERESKTRFETDGLRHWIIRLLLRTCNKELLLLQGTRFLRDILERRQRSALMRLWNPRCKLVSAFSSTSVNLNKIDRFTHAARATHRHMRTLTYFHVVFLRVRRSWILKVYSIRRKIAGPGVPSPD